MAMIPECKNFDDVESKTPEIYADLTPFFTACRLSRLSCENEKLPINPCSTQSEHRSFVLSARIY